MNDLISRSAAITAIQKAYTDTEGGTDKPAVWKNVGLTNALHIMQDLPSAQPEQRWIPVSERLPEEDDYKSCIECLDGAVCYFTENGTMGLGYYYESTKEWSTTDDLETDGKVVAWMPLPEPYSERRTDNADVDT